MAIETDTQQEYGVHLTSLDDVDMADCVAFAVGYNEFKALSIEQITAMFDKDQKENDFVGFTDLLNKNRFPCMEIIIR